jgi:hypothetical protein
MTTAAPAKPGTELAIREESQALTPFQVIERVITSGDLSQMKPQERVDFYWRTCESLGLNPLTRPFEFINLNGKLTMYARKDATDQLRRINHVSVDGLERKVDADTATVEARGSMVDPSAPGGIRRDSALGVVTIKGLSGDALSNALMKAETKAKRRLTLSLVGLGFLDESEVEGAERVDVDPTTGVIAEKAKPKSLLEKVQEEQAKLAGDEPAGDPDPEPAGDVDEVEGEASELPFAVTAEEPAPPAFIDTLQAAAAASDLEGPASTEQLAELGKVFTGWDAELVKDGIRAAFGREAIGRPTAQQAAAIVLVANSMQPAAFLAAWRDLAGVTA